MNQLEKKNYMSIGTLGHVDHGKTTLTSAITKFFGKKFKEYAEIDRTPEEKKRKITITLFHTEVQTKKRVYGLIDCPGHADYIKNMITGAAQMDCIVLVISAEDGVMPQTKEHLLLAKQIGLSKIVVFINKSDKVKEEEILQLVEIEARETLNKYGFDGEKSPVLFGSAMGALNGDQKWEKIIFDLMEVIDNFPDPIRNILQPFLMPIEDTMEISGRGTVVTGRVERGIIKKGKEVEILGFSKDNKAVVTGIEMFNEEVEGVAGYNIGVLLRGIKRDQVKRGQVLAEPGSIKTHTNFQANCYIFSKDEGGRHTPFFKNYRPQIFSLTADVTCIMELPQGIEMVMPGDNVNLGIVIIAPIAIEEGTKFSIREGGKTVGKGIVTKIIK